MVNSTRCEDPPQQTGGYFKTKHFVSSILFITLTLSVLLLFSCNRPPYDMVWIPPGEFLMGTDQTDSEGKALEFGIISPWYANENPARSIRLEGFYIDRHEVTQGKYARFVSATGHPPPLDWNTPTPPLGFENHPVVFVNWEDARAYCDWEEKRLPTEAEWEKAARGSDGREYPWGGSFNKARANVGGILGRTAPVGQYERGKSPYGVYDLIGNVWEWTADWYEAYPGNTYTSEKFGQTYKVLRGNSWAGVGHYPPEEMNEILAHHSRASFRLFADPNSVELNDVGFRCAKSD